MPTSKNDLRSAKERGAWLYALLMKNIEPELTEDAATVEQRHANETPIQRRARMAHYEEAFKEFDRVLTLMSDAMVSEAQEQKQSRRKQLKMQESSEHSHEMGTAEQQLDSFDDA